MRGSMDIENLDVYYEDCVIGGPGAFVVPIHERKQFIEATRTKLVLEISGREPEPRVVPASSQAPRISCTIGETMWRERWGGYDFSSLRCACLETGTIFGITLRSNFATISTWNE